MPTPARKGSQIPPTSPVNALSTSQPRDIPGGTSGSSSTTASHSNFNTNVNTKSSSNANGNNNSKNKNEHLTPSGPRRNNSLSTSPSTNIAIGSGGSDDRHERERQRAQDMDLAMSMSRARSNSTVLSPELKPGLKQRGSSHSHGHGHKHGQGVGHYPATSPSNESPRLLGRGGGRGSTFPKLTEAEEDEMERAKRGGGGDDEEEDDDDDEEGAQGGSDDERSELGSASDVPSRRRRRLEGRRYLDDGGYGYYSNQDQVRSQAVVDDDDRFDLDDGKRGYLSMGVSGGSGGRGSSRRLKTPASRRRPRDRRTSGGGGGGDAGGLGHSDQNSDTDQYDGHVHGGPLSVGSRSSMRFDDHRSDDMGHGHGAGSNGLRSVDGSRISLQDERERRDRGGFDDDEPDNGMGGRRHRGSPRIQTSVMGMSGGMGNQRNHFDFEPMEEFASKEGRSHSNAEHKGDAGSALYDVDTKDMDMDTGAATGTGMGTSTTSSPEWIESASVIQEPILDSGDQKGTIRTSKDLLRQQEDDFSSPLSKTITRASATDADLASPAQDGSGNSNINFVRRRQRKSNNTNPLAHSRRTGRLALFEGFGTALTDDMPPQDQSFTVDVSGETLVNAQGGMSSVHPTKAPRFPKKPLLPPKGYSDFPDPSAPAYTSASRPYRFSFYSNALPATIHARSLAELPAEGQSFEDLFVGRAGDAERKAYEGDAASNLTPSGAATPDQMHAPVPNPKMSLLARAAGAAASKAGNGDTPSSKPDPADDPEANTWWLDVLSPTDEEMRMLAQVFGIHPLTTEDILLEETREKIELFRNYYLVCFRSFDQDPYSQTYLEPLNMYIIVFREGTLSVSFRQFFSSEDRAAR